MREDRVGDLVQHRHGAWAALREWDGLTLIVESYVSAPEVWHWSDVVARVRVRKVSIGAPRQVSPGTVGPTRQPGNGG